LQQVFTEQIVNGIPTGSDDRFHLHLTPDYSRIHGENPPYKFFNKPMGLKHWMEQGLGFSGQSQQLPDGINDNTIFIILDPDEMILEPFKAEYTNDTYMQWHGQYEPWFLPKQQQQSDNTNPLLKIRKGHPFAQLYNFGGAWVHSVNRNISSVIQAAAASTTTTNNNNNNPQWTAAMMDHYYAAGPPYMAVASDMYAIVSTWAGVVVPVYQSTRDHLSEMFAYSTAAAYLNLPHQLSYSFMVSNPEVKWKEGWHQLDNSNDHNNYFPPLADRSYEHPSNNNKNNNRPALPNVLHYCQRYFLGPYFFSKYKLPKMILTCNHPLLLVPPSLLINGSSTKTNNSSDCGSIAFLYNSSVTPNGVFTQLSPKDAKHHAFMLCHMTYGLNDALQFWKQQHCKNDPSVTYEKTYVFPMDKPKKIKS
jgi:hypothetical protein